MNKILLILSAFFFKAILNIKLLTLNYIQLILENVNTITSVDDTLIKMKGVIALSYLLSPIALFSFKILGGWYISNSDYVLIILAAIAIDHLLGTIKYLFFVGDFNIKENIKGLTVKIFLVVCMGILFEGLNILVSQDSIIKDYLVIVTRLMVFLYPALSAFRSSSIISGGKFPPKAWIIKVKEFQKDLKTKHFKDE